MDEATLLRAAMAALYAHCNGDLTGIEADGVMFAIDDHLAEHDPEWRREFHELARDAEGGGFARQKSRRWLRRLHGVDTQHPNVIRWCSADSI